jgi:hypothetical protein
VSGSGTLSLSGGTDPAFTLLDPGDASTPLGEFDVTTAGEIVSDALPRDVDDYLAQTASTVVLVECLSGSVVIEQIKLYIHPPGGPVGGWRTAPGFTVEVSPNVFQAASIGHTEGSGADNDYVVAWDDAALGITSPGLAEQVDPASITTDPTVTVIASASVGVIALAPPLWNATAEAFIGGVLAQQPDAENVARLETPRVGDIGTYGVDVVFSPYEVPGDLGVEFPGDQPSSAWAPWTMVADYDIDDHGTSYVTSTVVPDTAIDDPTGLVFSRSPDVTIADGTYTPPSARTVLLGAITDIMFAPLPYDGPTPPGFSYSAGTDAEAIFTVVDCVVTVPSYSYWSPLGALHPLRLMQRGDELGMGSGRVLGAGTRQGSIRVFGSL